MGILEANINHKEIILKDLYNRSMLKNTLGGRIHFYKHLGKMVFIYDGASDKEKDLAQDDNSLYGKIIFLILKIIKK